MEETSTRMGLPLQIARGGLREGVILEMMSSPAARGA
jgi:exopolyphosphatase/pppGpp-phosphohydrolase